MPAKKPQSLNERNDAKDDIEAREAAEKSLTPSTPLTAKPPDALKGHKVASDEWVKLIKLYNELDAKIVTKLDERMLITYCKLIEEELKLEQKVADLDEAQQAMLVKAEKITPNDKNFKSWVNMWAQVN